MIGGNTVADFQVRQAGEYRNPIGEREAAWISAATLYGYLDLVTGDAKYNNYSAKLQESSHIFLCDYIPLAQYKGEKRMIIDGDMYDVLLVDDPMGMHRHLEIYLRYVGR